MVPCRPPPGTPAPACGAARLPCWYAQHCPAGSSAPAPCQPVYRLYEVLPPASTEAAVVAPQGPIHCDESGHYFPPGSVAVYLCVEGFQCPGGELREGPLLSSLEGAPSLGVVPRYSR